MFLRVVLSSALVIASVGCVKRASDQKAAKVSSDSLQMAIDKSKTTPSYENFIGLGLEYAKKGNSDGAVGAYKRASQINPKAPLAWNNICAEMNGRKQYSEAISYCEKALAVEPNFTLAQNNLAFAKKKIDETKVAVMKRKDSLMATPGAKSADFLKLGMDFYNIRELATANELWAKIKKGDPNYATAKNNRASAYIMMNQLASAEKELKEALSLEPKNQLFLNNKAWLEQKKSEVR